MTRPFCRPLSAGIASSRQSVARRLSRLLNALEFEITGYVADSDSVILDRLAVLKREMLESLRAEGWRVDYLDGPNKWRVLAGKGVRA